jgi:hypothetical protein
MNAKNSLLITSAGNLQTFSNVLVGLSSHLGDRSPIGKILLLNEETADSRQGISNDAYQNLAESILGSDVELRLRKLSSDPRSTIASLVVDGAREVGRELLIIDLTAGSKLISAVLYASASFAQIEHLYYVKVERIGGIFANLAELPDPKSHCEIQTLSPLREVKDLGSQCYFDLLFYDALLDDLDARGEVAGLQEVSSVTVHLRNALHHFFSNPGRYLDAIRAIGVAREILQGLMAEALTKRMGKSEPLKLKKIEEWANVYRSDSEAGRINPIIPEFLVLDLMLNTLRHWRNAAMHKPGAQFSGSNVRVAIIIIIELIDTLILVHDETP